MMHFELFSFWLYNSATFRWPSKHEFADSQKSLSRSKGGPFRLSERVLSSIAGASPSRCIKIADSAPQQIPGSL
jgi:hypothetical protein